MPSIFRPDLIERFWRRMVTAHFSRQFRRRCVRAGQGLEILGPCLVEGAGIIDVGANFSIRSRYSNQTEIFVGDGARLKIGNDVFINQGVRIVCSVGVQLGDGCLIGDESVILDNDYHSVGNAPVKSGPVCIGAGVWIATRVIVLRGVTIGEGSVIAAGSVVTRSIPPYSLAAGNPARIVKSLK